MHFKKIEQRLRKIQPEPSERFYRSMSTAPWMQTSPHPKGLPMNARMRFAAVAVLSLIALAALLVFTPQGRSLAQQIIHFFTRASGDTQPIPTLEPPVWVDATTGEAAPTITPTAMAAFAAECGDFTSPKCSVEQIRSMANFPVLELGTIPDGMYFVGATGGPDRIWISYDNGQHNYGISLIEERWTGNSTLLQWEIGASAVVETVQIGNVTGEYVKGAFILHPSDPFTTPAPGENNRVWDVYAGVHTLRWIDHDVFFELQEYSPTSTLQKEKLVALAAGLTSKPVSSDTTRVPATQTPPAVIEFEGDTYDLSVAKAEELAGFDVLEPEKLPRDFLFSGASFLPEQNIVRIFYIEPQSVTPSTFGIRISQQVIPADGDCLLCGMVVGNYFDSLKVKTGKVVGANAVIETIQVGDVPGQYVEGMWAQAGSWTWLPYPSIMTLRWQANGMAFEIQYFGYTINNMVPLSKADLVTIALRLR
jgi:hypothetical protein